MALAKDDPNKVRLWQLNNRRRTKGLPTFDSLQKAIDEGAYKPRGKNGAPREARAKIPPKKAARKAAGGDPPARPPAEISAPANGHGTEHDLSLLGGVIIQELQKERDALDLAIAVIERRFAGAKTAT